MSAEPSLPSPDAGSELSVEAVVEVGSSIAAGDIQLIDCREQDEWDFNRLPHAELVPLSAFVDRAQQLIVADKPAIIYCHHGMRSLQATEWLRSKGHQHVWSMSGGIDRWSQRIDPAIPRY